VFVIRDLLDLVASGAPDAENRIEAIFSWEFDRSMSAARFLLGFAGSLFIALLVSTLQGQLGFWRGLSGFLLTTLPGIYGAIRLRRTRDHGSKYLAALRLHAQLRGMAPFLRRYLEFQ
jgi:hypothetical protein